MAIPFLVVRNWSLVEIRANFPDAVVYYELLSMDQQTALEAELEVRKQEQVDRRFAKLHALPMPKRTITAQRIWRKANGRFDLQQAHFWRGLNQKVKKQAAG